MLKEAALFCLALLVQLAVLFGCSYIIHRYFRRRSSDLAMFRKGTRLFGGFAAVFVFLVLLLMQIVKQGSWAWPFIAPIWVITVFIAHDLALGLAIKNKKSNKAEMATPKKPSD